MRSRDGSQKGHVAITSSVAPSNERRLKITGPLDNPATATAGGSQ